MRHQIDHRKLGRTTEHRIAMLRNQAASLVRHDRIQTTLEKAKELRRFVERLITLAKKDTLHARRTAARHVQDPAVLKKLFSTLGPLYAQRPGGYTRIVKLGFRKGDGAQVALIELVDREPKVEESNKGKGKGKAQKAAKPAPAPAAEETAPKKARAPRKPKATAVKEATKAEAAPEQAAEPAQEPSEGEPGDQA
jgi:large subunit ribosomal protein L17